MGLNKEFLTRSKKSVSQLCDNTKPAVYILNWTRKGNESKGSEYLFFFFTFCCIVRVDIAAVPTVPLLNTGWDRRTSHRPPADTIKSICFKLVHFIFHWVVDFFLFTVQVFPQVFHCECWIIPLNTLKIRICERLWLKSSVRVQSSFAIMWTLVWLITQNTSFILFLFCLLCVSPLHVWAVGRNVTFPD